MKLTLTQLFPFLSWTPQVSKRTLSNDLMAGLTGAIIVLPQGVAYAFIAGLPPEYGLYTAIITPIIAALYGSSLHLISGPTAAISIVVINVATTITELGGGPTPSHYIATVLAITLLAGLIQLAMGLLRLGTVINFISHTVVFGFTAGAAILILSGQLKHLFGVDIAAGLSFIAGLNQLAAQLGHINPYSLAIGLLTLFTAIAVRRCNRKWPHLLIGMLVGSIACWLVDGASEGVALVGALPGTLPPFAVPPLTPDTIASLFSGAVAVALLGLIEAVSIARAIAVRSQQQIDGNQEFIGQGLSNIVGSFFSCYAGSGSFTRSGANYDAGARTPLSAIFAALLLAAIMVLVPNVTHYLPLPAMAGAILLIAWNLIDFYHIKQIIVANKAEAVIFSTTFLATLFMALEWAIYVGIAFSLLFYLARTAKPSITDVAPIQHLDKRPLKDIENYQLAQCPQVKCIRIDGSLFFGAIAHTQQQLRLLTADNETSIVVVIGKGINFIDVSGAQMLVQEINRIEQQGGQLIFSSFKDQVIDELDKQGYLKKIGRQRFYSSPQPAIRWAINQLNPQHCQHCSTRIFHDCPSVPKFNM